MAVDFNEIIKYATKAGIFDIEEAFNLMSQGKLPEGKVKSLMDVMSYAKEKGINDLQTAAYKYDTESGKKKNPLARYAMEKDLETMNKAFYAQLAEKQAGSLLTKDYAASLGYNTRDQKQMNEFYNRYDGDAYQALEAAKRWQEQNPQATTNGPQSGVDGQRGPNPMTGEPQGYVPKTRKELDEARHMELDAERRKKQSLMHQRVFEANQKRGENYLKLISGGVTQEMMKNDPLWGNPAYREMVLKDNPNAIWHGEELSNSLNNSNLYSRLQGLASGQPSPERQLYNAKLAAYTASPWFGNQNFAMPQQQQNGSYAPPQQIPRESGLSRIKSLLGYQ